MTKKCTVPYEAYYGGRLFALSRSEWSKVLGCTEYHVNVGLRKHKNNMQALIDACFSDQQRMQTLINKFLYSKPISCGGVDDQTRSEPCSPCILSDRVALTKNYGDNVCL